MPQAFFKACEYGLLVAAFEIDNAVGVQPSLRKRRRKQVQAREAPEHFAAGAGGDPCGEERGGRAVDRAVAAASDLMQCAKRQRPTGKPRVYRWDSEGQRRRGAPVLALDLPDPGAQRLDCGWQPHGVS
jgi:hypothetical protein